MIDFIKPFLQAVAMILFALLCLWYGLIAIAMLILEIFSNEKNSY